MLLKHAGRMVCTVQVNDMSAPGRLQREKSLEGLSKEHLKKHLEHPNRGSFRVIGIWVELRILLVYSANEISGLVPFVTLLPRRVSYASELVIDDYRAATSEVAKVDE